MLYPGIVAVFLFRIFPARKDVRSLVPDNEQRMLESSFNLEDDSISEQFRRDTICLASESYGMALFDACSSLADVRVAFEGGKLSKTMIHRAVKDLFD